MRAPRRFRTPIDRLKNRNSEFVNGRVTWPLGFSLLFSFRRTKRFLATLVALFLLLTARAEGVCYDDDAGNDSTTPNKASVA
jgi:hypothetical protein